ncbi:DUF6077 domain-containing protein [Actinomadura hibisca]|uniref:DUF6077 domain-containing protein n=1 Tax=Actinomadura hibisca TaxID=68565 RepID=UPI000830C775|nr:DUF6077 domain-containing protein [Actinomadura hibisca]
MIHVDDRTAGPVPAPGGGRRPANDLLTRALDGVGDGVVLAFALWTLVYHLGLLLEPPTWALLAGWAVAAAALTGLYLYLRPEDAPRPREWPGRVAGVPRAVPVTAVVAGIGAGVCAGLTQDGAPWALACVLGVVSVAATAYAVFRGRIGRTDAEELAAAEREEAATARWGSPVALVTGLGFAVASLFFVNTDGDDTFFVSRSVATAATGRIPAGDVIFSRQTTGPIAGEPPVSSVEVLVGAVARVLGLHASSLLWYAMLPGVVFLAVWSLWRLARTWSARRAPLCFALGAVYLLWSGPGAASLGSFHLLRMWQGKAMMLSVLIPLLYVYLTRWTEGSSRTRLLMLAATGVTAVGLTSSAAFVIPLAVAAAVGPLLLTRRLGAAAGACAALAYPVLSGATVVLLHDNISVLGDFHDARATYGWIMLSGMLGVLAGAALWAGPWTARPGVPALLVAGIGAVTTVLLVPGVLEVLRDVTGAGQVLWRTLWIVPIPVLIGLAATLPAPAGRGRAVRVAVAAVPAIVVAACLVLGGTPLWSWRTGTVVEARPTYKLAKVEKVTTAEVLRTVERRGVHEGVLVMPQPFMRVTPMLTTDIQAANPNTHYLKMLPAPRAFIDDRLMLTEAVRSPGSRKPDPATMRQALARTGVVAACVTPRDRRGLRVLQRAGYGDRTRIKALTCVFPQGS